MKRTRIATHRIGMIGPLWLLQEKKKFWFIPYWKTIMSSPFYEDCTRRMHEEIRARRKKINQAGKRPVKNEEQ